jgi:acyl dehydratase
VKYYEDFVVGDETVGLETYAVTEAEVREIGERWDPQPFHVDPVAAVRSPFGGLVASSVHLFAICVGLSNRGQVEPVAAVSALGFDELRLHAPARPGDELRVNIVVLDRRRSKSRPELGVVRTRAELVNQREELVFSDEAAFLIQLRPSGG